MIGVKIVLVVMLGSQALTAYVRLGGVNKTVADSASSGTGHTPSITTSRGSGGTTTGRSEGTLGVAVPSSVLELASDGQVIFNGLVVVRIDGFVVDGFGNLVNTVGRTALVRDNKVVMFQGQVFDAEGRLLVDRNARVLDVNGGVILDLNSHVVQGTTRGDRRGGSIVFRVPGSVLVEDNRGQVLVGSRVVMDSNRNIMDGNGEVVFGGDRVVLVNSNGHVLNNLGQVFDQKDRMIIDEKGQIFNLRGELIVTSAGVRITVVNRGSDQVFGATVTTVPGRVSVFTDQFGVPSVTRVPFTVTTVTAPFTQTIFRTTTVDSFLTRTKTVFNSVPVTITDAVISTITSFTNLVVRTPVNNLVAVFTTVVSRQPTTVTVTETMTNVGLVTEQSVIQETITHTSYLITHSTVTTSVTQTLTATPTLVRTTVFTLNSIFTDFRTVTNTLLVPLRTRYH